MFRASRTLLAIATLSACVESQVVLSGTGARDDAATITASEPDAASDDACSGDACVSSQPDVIADVAPDVDGDAPAGGPCGGLAGLQCAADEWCDYDACGAGDELGTCRKRPTNCNTVAPCLSPVCGCNGTTYCDSCLAQKAGTDVRASGPC